jgi:methylthioribose-1-phosphate isomerase
LSSRARFSAFETLTRRIQDEKLLAPLWPDADHVALLDQTRLPFARKVVHIHSAADGVDALYPAFDVTPARLLTGIITKTGTLTAPFEPKLRVLLRSEKDTVA